MYRTRLARIADLRNSTRAGMMTLPEEGNFFTYFFFRDKMPIDINMLVFFLGKCVRTAPKTMVVDRKNQQALALLYLASGPLQNAANSGVVPTKFAAEPTTKMKSSKANLVT